MLKEMTKELFLEPEKLMPGIGERLRKEISTKVEGSCAGKAGYILSVTDIKEISKGVIHDSTGDTCFKIKYNAILLKPFKNEVLDALVTEIHKMGFFCQIGPLQIFVSVHQIPEELVFDSSGIPVFQNKDQSLKIEKNSHVRLKIIGTRIDLKDIFAVGTIKEDYLGII